MHTPRPSSAGRGALARLALAGVVGPPLFVAVFTLAGLLRPGYSPLRQEVSALGVGPMSWLQNANFLVFGALLMMFAVGFAVGIRGVVAPRWRRTMLILLVLSGVGVILSGVFTAAPATVVLHWLGGFVLAFLPPIVVSFVAAAQLRHVPAWRPYARYSLVVGIGAVALIAATFVFLNPAFPALNQLGGLLQRLLVVDVFSWHVVLGWRLWRLPTSGTPAGCTGLGGGGRDACGDDLGVALRCRQLFGIHTARGMN